MGAVETAARAELAALPEPARSSALAAAVIVLAQRLDDSPGDAVASMLVRELRRRLPSCTCGSRGPDWTTLSVSWHRIAAPDIGNPAH